MTVTKMAATGQALPMQRMRSANGMGGAAGPAAGFKRTYTLIAIA